MSDPTPDEVRRLRAVDGLSVREIRARTGLGRNRVYELLRGVPPPEWTRRPNAKDDLRARAIELRASGCSVPDIAARLGVAKSTAYQWVRHLPARPDDDITRAGGRARMKAAADARWAAHRAERDAARAGQHERAATTVGSLDDRDLLLLGAAVYWCEGTKSKPWRRDDHVQLVNSDPGLLALFLRFLETCGVDRSVPSYRVSIHETADADAATTWWARRLGLPPDRFGRPTVKKHRPTTVRRNVGADYHGCLVINVPRSRELYWRIEGMIAELFRKAGGTGVDSAGR
ncbi:helix-turn-helix domain-containing protein [Micromonospora sp. WMMD812]|uniref:helix-turn-helix domain-containing protein n=1 Tax=Micromonospora sp. WMMD812 TaxID=3015152 RepID=UPI00248B040D|nr:helix-turn-helix domain-containing protein [Micromonospora sp. WMMD812]WBB65090.1 helix-turn-helix domain containing protein [Micromonospora sp. WMMD812]